MDYANIKALYAGSLRKKNIVFLSREIQNLISGAELKWLTVRFYRFLSHIIEFRPRLPDRYAVPAIIPCEQWR